MNNMKLSRYSLLILIISFVTLNAQVEFFGEFIPGSLVIGKAEYIKSVSLNGKELDFDKDGIFTLGFDRDETGVSYLRIKFTEGNTFLKKIVLPERDYNIQHINVKKEYVTPNKTSEPRIAKERKIKKEARAKVGEVKEALFASGFMKPVKGGRKSSVFGSQRIYNGIPRSFHNGLDYALPRGTPVYAMADGKVLLAADNFYYSGNFILLDHGLGINSVYLHLSKKDVKAGEFVKKGQKIGEIGTTGRSTGPHLHWGVQWYGKRVDPALILKMKFQ